jgi:exosortase/archaeosortase family protein
LDVLTARITAFLIGSLGLDALRRSTVLIHPSGFGYEIYYYCTGLVPAAFLVAGVLSAPAGWASKLWAIGVGVPLVLALNLTRLVSLFVIGVSFPRAFAFAHDVAGQALMVFGVFGLWLVWLRRAARASPGAALTTPRDVLAAPAASRL